METKQFILLGPPGVDVNAHAAALAERWQISAISMAALVRDAIAKESAIGLEARPFVEADALVPDPLVLKLLRKRLEQPDAMLKGWVLEGFPRTMPQAQGLDDWLSTVGQPPATVVYLQAKPGLLLNRLATEPGQTQPMSALRQQLEHYEQAIAPILEHYQQRDQLTPINANLSFAEIDRDLAQLGQEDTGAAPLIADESALNTLIAQESRLVVDCMAMWCGSCKQVTPSIDKLAETYQGRVTVMKIDFDANRQISKRFGLKGIPAVMYFREGQLLEILTGVRAYAEYDAVVARLLA
ncbi:nucleoside monophosphate kinase [Nodosilinea sp. LEGE 07088]|uniref:nucleoside monophosphate kinase n=1 Tax=Nodosilinea sp. LEGE 07088 TaxID=2777968 RepID=UPI00187F3AF9|nr:nucleoside monophosphate kinase [Nodosilinea sp. LEGE 07088]MBE9138673.1 nucleoside monophosphate kinase [Nodosilinea sp. LEGE 07088]